MTVSPSLPSLLLPDPALLAAGSALAAQRAALAVALARLEGARARVPAAQSGGSWRGFAQTAYAASVHELCRGLDEAILCVRTAQQCTARAVSTIAARVG